MTVQQFAVGIDEGDVAGSGLIGRPADADSGDGGNTFQDKRTIGVRSDPG